MLDAVITRDYNAAGLPDSLTYPASSVAADGFFASTVDLIANGALLDLQVAIDNYRRDFGNWLAGCRAALAYCNGGDVPIPTGVADAGKAAVRASTALMQMINQDLSAREQQRDVVLEQARRDFESFRNEDLLGYAEVNGKSVPVVAVSVLDFADGALMTSINPRTGGFWSGTPVLAASYMERYVDWASDHFIKPGAAVSLLPLGVWPKSLAPATDFRPAALGSENPLTSVPRALGVPGAGSAVIRTGAAAIGLGTVFVGMYNATIAVEGFFYAIPSYGNNSTKDP